MRRGWMIFLGFLVVAYLAATTILSTLTLEDFTRRPVTGLLREIQAAGIDGPRIERLRLADERDFFGDQAAGTAKPLGASGFPIGQRLRYRLPGGEVVACTHILRWIICDGGWQAIRGAGGGAA